MGRLFAAFVLAAFTVEWTGGGHVAGITDEVFGEIFAEEFGHNLQLLFEVFVERIIAFYTVHKKTGGGCVAERTAPSTAPTHGGAALGTRDGTHTRNSFV